MHSVERCVIVVKHGRNSVKVNEDLCRLVVVFHHQLFELDFGLGLLVVRAKVDVQFFGEELEVCKPCGLVCQIIDEERLKVIKSRILQEGQNVVDLRSIVGKRLQLGPKVEFTLEEEAPKLLRVLTIEWVGVLKFSLRCCGPIPTSIFCEPFECREQPTNLCLAVCLCIRVGIRYWVTLIGVRIGIIVASAVISAAVITWITLILRTVREVLQELPQCTLGEDRPYAASQGSVDVGVVAWNCPEVRCLDSGCQD
jgi:hypothetical protein